MPDSALPSHAIFVQTQEEERYRLARVLQNGPAQVLANAALEIETSLALLEDQPQAARAGLAALASELRQALTHLRELIAELQPPLLFELGLTDSLVKYTQDYAKTTGIGVSLDGWDTLTRRLPSTMEVAVFRIIQEALENVRAHAHATRVRICLNATPEQLVVRIEDNGRGFPPVSAPAAPGRRLGLVGMRDRAELLGGQLQVYSEPDRGVRVVLSIPRHGHSM